MTDTFDLSRQLASPAVSVESYAPAQVAAPKAAALGRGRIAVLDGLRGVAILLVMVFHFYKFGFVEGNALWERAYANIANFGWSGVDLFFVLSGFLITGILYSSREEPHYFRTFYARRTVRIFPLYYGFLVFFFGLVPLILGLLHHRDLLPFLDNKTTRMFAWTYSLNWLISLRGFQAVSVSIQHFWSLAIEEQFYFVWPFLVLVFSRRTMMGLCAMLIPTAFILRIAAMLSHYPDAAYAWTFCRMDSLAIGALLALAAKDSMDWERALKWTSSLLLPVAIGLAVLLETQYAAPQFLADHAVLASLMESFMGLFFAGCLVVAVSSSKGSFTNRSLSSPVLTFFGKYSYCLYIVHMPIIILFRKLGFYSDTLAVKFGNEFLAVLVLNAIAFGISTAIALASWNLYEKQWLKLKDLPLLQRASEAT